MTQKLPGRLEVWEGQSPLDAVGGLVRAANLHTVIDVEWFAPALVDALCTDLAHPELFACGEHELLGHHKHISRVVPINLGGDKGVICVLRIQSELDNHLCVLGHSGRKRKFVCPSHTNRKVDLL